MLHVQEYSCSELKQKRKRKKSCRQPKPRGNHITDCKEQRKIETTKKTKKEKDEEQEEKEEGSGAGLSEFVMVAVGARFGAVQGAGANAMLPVLSL